MVKIIWYFHGSLEGLYLVMEMLVQSGENK